MTAHWFVSSISLGHQAYNHIDPLSSYEQSEYAINKSMLPPKAKLQAGCRVQTQS